MISALHIQCYLLLRIYILESLNLVLKLDVLQYLLNIIVGDMSWFFLPCQLILEFLQKIPRLISGGILLLEHLTG